MPPKIYPSVNSPKSVPGESINRASTPTSNTTVDHTAHRPSSTAGSSLGNEATKVQAQGASAEFESHYHNHENINIVAGQKIEIKSKTVITRCESTEITISKYTEVKERLSDFELSEGTLKVKIKDDTGLFVKREIKLDDYLGFTKDGSLSWEETGFSTVAGVKIEIRGSKVFAVYKGRESHIDLFDKIRVFNGELTILSFSTRMYSQVPWMNFRILAYPTMNLEIEAMITRSTARIALSTVKTASTKLQQEIDKLIETTISSVHEEIDKRVRLEVECLKETMQMNMQQEMFATMQAGLVGPVDWDTMRKEFEGREKEGVIKHEAKSYSNGVNHNVKLEAHSAWAD